MSISTVFTGRGITVPESFKEHVESKTEKISQLATDGQRLEVKVSHSSSHQRSDSSITVELTVVGAGKVIRSEAQAGDKFPAFEVALNKLTERLRRARDKRKQRVRSNGTLGHPAPSLGNALSEASTTEGEQLIQRLNSVEDPGELKADTDPVVTGEAGGEEDSADGLVKIRQKVFPAQPLTAEAAVDAMELVGHSFYLYIDADSGLPSAVYRRKGYSYGVISLGDTGPNTDPSGAEHAYRAERGTTRSKVESAS